MNSVLEGVLSEFSFLNQIPRQSGHEERVAAALADRLEKLGYSSETDGANNLICDVPATAGYEAAGRIALQAHTDMVCVGAVDYHPETDPIHTVEKDGWLCSDGRSSLGADCGIGLAVAMYLVREQVPHGPLRLIFTADEEEGLAGARKLRTDCLDGCCALINLDSFHFGQLLISSAGGFRQSFTKETDRFFPMLEHSVCLRVSGLLGGHSGDDIGLHRANAARLLVWLLQSLQMPYELAELHAGHTHNAIPTEGTALLLIDQKYLDELRETVRLFTDGLREIYPAEAAALQVEISDAEYPAWVLTVDERDNLLALAALLLCDEAAKHPLFPEVTGSSGSMGMLQADAEQIELRSFLRSVDADFLSSTGSFFSMAAQGFGYAETGNSYPAWPGESEDWLTDLFLQAGEQLGIPQKKTAVHVGLETSIFHAMAPALPMVTVGMDIEGAHSVGERVRLSTIEPFTRLLAEVLKQAAEREPA